MKKVSIAIPCYEMKDKGVEFLNYSLHRIASQTYSNIQVVISDHSKDDKLQNLSKFWNKKLDIKYLKNFNRNGSSSANLNYALDNCDGDLIKILFQDDFLFHSKSIEKVVEKFSDEIKWLVTSCIHTQNGIDFYRNHTPVWNNNILFGENTISSPSVLTIHKTVKERFDENLLWLMDCEFYYRLFLKFDLPKILHDCSVANRIWGGQVTNDISEILKQQELQYVIKKFDSNKNE